MGSGKWRGIIFAAVALLLAVFFVNGLYALNALNNKHDKDDRQKKGERADNLTVRDEKHDESGIAWEAPVNLLILGLDDEEARSDVMLLVNFSPAEGRVNMLSIARDTRINLEGKHVKINALISLGGERAVVDRVESITGLPVHYYITLNFAGFRKIVDTLEGVDFVVPFDMDYDDPDQNLHINLARGRQTLNGREAEQLVRYRKGNRPGEGYEDADIGRMKMQQDFIRALIRQKAKLKYISRADDIFIILQKHLVTNIGMGDIRRYLKYVINIKPENVNAFILPGDSVYMNNVWYFIYDRKKTRELISECFFR
jgi:LCP family protein required for cell wall assembly